jgi:hypothetical protein
MQARHIFASLVLHLVLIVVAADTSPRIYEEAELQQKLAAAEEYATTSRLARMRTMVDEMEVIADVMERVVRSWDDPDVSDGRGRAREADPAGEVGDPAPERDSRPPSAEEAPTDDTPAPTPDAEREEGNEAERLAAEATDLEERIDQVWRAALAEGGIESPSEAQGGRPGDANGAGVAGGITAMNAAARRRLRDVLALQDARNGGTDLAWDDTAAYWSQFGLDALGGRSPDEFENRPDESELARDRNGRSARLDNRQLRNEIEGAVLAPARAFLGPGDRSRWVYLDSWYTIGPFPNPERREHDTRFPPEENVDLDAIYVASDGLPVEWTYVRATSPRVAPPTMDEYTVHYAYTEIRSDRPREVWLALGSDDSVRAWLNGERVWESDVHLKEWHLADGFRRVELRPGYNTLLLRLENAWGPGFFSASIRLEE